MVRCAKCRNRILHEESAFSVLLYKEDGGTAGYDIIRTKFLRDEDVAIHVNGDRQCGQEISGYRSKIRKELGISEKSDLSFLDSL